MNITIQGTRLDLSDQIKTYVYDKLEDCFRAFGDMNLEPVTVHVELERTTRRHPQERTSEQRYRAEANVSLPGRMLRAEGTGPNLKQAVVRMKHKLTREIRQWRGRVIDEARSGARTFNDAIGTAPAARGE